MPEQFLHGVEVVEINDGPRPIRTVKSSVIGIVGTAPASEAAVAAALTLGTGTSSLAFTADAAGLLGNEISVRIVKPSASNAALSVALVGKAITINLATGADGAATSTATLVKTALDANTAIAALIGVAISGGGGGVVAPSPTRFLTGGLDEAFPLNTPVLITGNRADAARLGLTGSLPSALEAIFDQVGAAVVVVRVTQTTSDSNATTIAAVAGDSTLRTGFHALLNAESTVGFVPRILCAPGFTANASVVTEAISVANKLRAVVIADGPNSTDAAAIAYAAGFGSDRLFVIDPSVKVVDAEGAEVPQAASGRVAGLIAKSDNERGFWWSPSNQEILGITGTTRAIDFSFGDFNSRANLLNEANVATIIRQNGFRLWGNRTTSADPKFAFLSVRRTADMINDSILRAHLWAVDRNISATYLEAVAEGVNGYLKSLQAQGAILGGKCWPDPDLNTPANVSQGKVFFNFDFTPPYPAEHVTFRSILVNDYIEEII